jgi:hypothetical protein
LRRRGFYLCRQVQWDEHRLLLPASHYCMRYSFLHRDQLPSGRDLQHRYLQHASRADLPLDWLQYSHQYLQRSLRCGNHSLWSGLLRVH